MSVVLGQEQLLEDAPTRTVIVPVDGLCHWGVDGAVERVSIGAAWVDGQITVRTESFAPAVGPKRLDGIFHATYHRSRSLALVAPPGRILIEQPSGKFSNPPLLYAMGVIQAAVIAGARDGILEHHGIRFTPYAETVTSSTWKKVACGRGDIYKPKRKRGEPKPDAFDYYVLRWARDELGYAGASWDEADALGMAVCSRRRVRFDVR